MNATNTNAVETLKRIAANGCTVSTPHGIFPVGVLEVHGAKLVWAQMFAEHQGQVHLAKDIRLEVKLPTMVDVYQGDEPYGTFEQMDADEIQANRWWDWQDFLKGPRGVTWFEFWQQVVEQMTS